MDYLLRNNLGTSPIATFGSIRTVCAIACMVCMVVIVPQQSYGQRDAGLLIEEVVDPIEDPAPKREEELSEVILPSSNVEQTTQKTQPTTQYLQKINQNTTNNTTSAMIIAGTISNKIDPTTIKSYGKGGGAGSILCSTIARINLNTMTGLPYQQGSFDENVIARGDAYALALRGSRQGIMIPTTKEQMEGDIRAYYEKTKNTIYDVYFYKASNGGVMQGHRAVVFIGIDDNIYILDTIRGLRGIAPQLLSDHFNADGYKGYTMYISSIAYVPKDEYKTHTEYYEIYDTVALTQLVQDDIAHITHNPMIENSIVLELDHPIKVISDNGEEVVFEVGAQIKVDNSKTVMGWDLVFQALPTQDQLTTIPSATLETIPRVRTWDS